MKLYDFMDMDQLEKMETAIEYVDYFMTVKQDILIKLDAVNWSIMNCKLRYEEYKAKLMLETDFRELYKKDNEDIRKAHINKECKEILKSLEEYKHKKDVYVNQLDVINDIIIANRILVGKNNCDCGGEN